MRTKRDVIDGAENKVDSQRQNKIDERGYIFAEQEQILGHIDLGEDFGVIHQGAHATLGCLFKERHDQRAAEQIGGIVRSIASKELSKDDFHDEQGEQRGKHAPPHAQHRTLVFFLEIPLDQL